MPSQRTAARLGFAAFVLAAITAAAAVAGVRLGKLSYLQGYRLMFPASALGLAALLAALVWLGAALRNNNRAGRKLGLTALAGSLLLLYPPLSTFAHRLSSPPLHDFTTDTENPPAFKALLKLRGANANSPAYDGDAPVAFDGKTQSLSNVLHDHYPDLLKPRAGFSKKNVFFWRDFEALKKTGWTLVDYNEREGRIEATTASFWFGRPFDIVIRARPAGQGARTDIRSQSRYDAIDDGANAANVRLFFRKLGR